MATGPGITAEQAATLHVGARACDELPQFYVAARVAPPAATFLHAFLFDLSYTDLHHASQALLDALHAAHQAGAIALSPQLVSITRTWPEPEAE